MSTPAEPALKRRQQYLETYRMTKRSDPRIGLWILLGLVVGAALGFLLLWVLPGSGVLKTVIVAVGTVLFGVLGAMLVFGRRAQRAAYAQMEGRLGAASASLRMLRRGWRVDEVVAFTKQQDVVHRVVGPPGIVLVGEGNPNRLRTVLANERRKLARVAADTPVHEVLVGNGEGQVPLRKLNKHVSKLGRAVKPAEMTDILNRLKALDAARPTVPLPRGPLPTSTKGLRGNLRGR